MSIYNPKTNKELRANARGQLIGKYSAAIFISVLVGTIEMLITSLYDSNTVTVGSYFISYVISIVVDLLMGVLIFGKSHFFLNMIRGKEPLMASDVFYGVKHGADKAILIQGVFTMIQLIFTLPMVLVNVGYIIVDNASYRMLSLVLSTLILVATFIANLYVGLSFYVLNDNPDMSVLEILKKSMLLMEKRKGRYVLLCLSLIPLCILSMFAFIIGLLWFIAFREVLIANFYLDAIGEEPFNPTIEKVEPEVTDHFDCSI